jgi:hypothetical protein
MIATHRKFVERATSHGRVDRESGVIRGVKLLGRNSRNGRVYTEEAMRRGVELYRNVKVYLGHPRSAELEEDRKFQDWLGIVENPRYESDGIYGDIRLRKESVHYKEIIEAAESFGSFFGASHVAEGISRFEHDIEYIEELGRVRSVDLVCDPASVRGLFESMTFQRETQEEIDTLVEEVERFANTATRLLQTALDHDEASLTSDAADVARTLGDTLAKWIDSPGSGTVNGKAVSDYAKQIINSIVVTLGDPLAPESTGQLEASLQELREFVNGLRDGRNSLIDDAAAANRDIEPIEESHRGNMRQEFAPLTPRDYSSDEVGKFAHRLR